MTEKIKVCPVCGTDTFTLFLSGKDYFLTSQEFSIIRCSKCGFRITDPIPSADVMGGYYESTDYISHESGGKKLINLVYKAARFLTVRSKFRLIRKYVKGKKLLDIGCGTGEFLSFCKGRGFECSGIEPNPKAREFAINRHKLRVKPELSFSEEENETYDCITMWHVLEHVYDLHGTLGSLKRALKKTGTLILALPNPDSWDAKHYKECWAAYDLPRHIYHFSSGHISALAKKHGFVLEKILPQYLDAFYISMLSENYRRRKKDPVMGFINGLRSNFHASDPSLGYSSHIYILSANFS
jgi:ubiquinone/menaquinone biosynthesis C-methylase UbiE